MRAAPAWQVQTAAVLTVGLISRDLFAPCASCSQDPSSEERFHVELHFSPGVKGCEEDRNVPTGFGFRPASAEVSTLPGHNCPVCWGPGDMANATSQAPRCSARLCAIQSLAARVCLTFLSCPRNVRAVFPTNSQGLSSGL